MSVTIRYAEPGDRSGIHALLKQMPDWEIATRYAFVDGNIVAVDDHGQIVGWLMGNHASEAWRNISGYDRAEDWQC